MKKLKQKREYFQSEIEKAIHTLRPLFLVDPDKQFEMPIVMIFRTNNVNLVDIRDGDDRGYINIDPEDTTNYTIGELVGHWYHNKINPQIMEEAKKAHSRYWKALIHDRKVNSEAEAFYRFENIASLVNVIEHYSGLYYNDKGPFSPEYSRLLDMLRTAKKTLETTEEGSDPHLVAGIQIRGYRSMQIAETLFQKFSINDFRRVTSMQLEEARDYLKSLARIDLLDKSYRRLPV